MPIIKNEVSDFEPIKRELQQYVSLKDEVTSIEGRVNTLKKRILSYVEDLGSANEKGSLVLPLNDEVTGTTSVVKQRRVSKMFDESAAESLLKSKDLFETCTKTIVTLDQDAVMAAYYDGKLTDADIETMFPEKVTWALVLEKK
jgi:hypothetical protein